LSLLRVSGVSVATSPLAAALRDRYVLKRELGRGGMATVYLAHDLKHGRTVAVKVLPEWASAAGLERFQREIELAARLAHPHILPLFDSGEAAGRLWYTMPYVEGESLRSRLRREGKLPLEDAVQIGREVAEALNYAHRHGVVHRDIKPENILLEDGHAILADFGLARAMSAASEEQLTTTGSLIGTAAYMSPEQASGDTELDGRRDIYSLGCVIFEMLTGEPPFAGPNPLAIVVRRWTEPPPRLRSLRTEVPQAIDEAVHCALAREPAERFATAGQFAQALTIHLAEHSTRTLALVRKFLHRRWWTWVGATIITSVALAFALEVAGGKLGAPLNQVITAALLKSRPDDAALDPRHIPVLGCAGRSWHRYAHTTHRPPAAPPQLRPLATLAKEPMMHASSRVFTNLCELPESRALAR
jgi:serine/threonine protein kinase